MAAGRSPERGPREGPLPRGAARPGAGTVAVVGIGNVLMGDDAFGPHVIKELEAAYEFPDGVDLFDAGTPGHDLTLYLEGRKALVVVDAVKAEGKPGELRLYRGEEIRQAPPPLVVSPHEPGLREALLKLEFAGGGPREVLLVGAIPERVDTGAGLSRPMRETVPAAVSEVLRALERLGVTPRERSPRAVPDLWWERQRH